MFVYWIITYISPEAVNTKCCDFWPCLFHYPIVLTYQIHVLHHFLGNPAAVIEGNSGQLRAAAGQLCNACVGDLVTEVKVDRGHPLAAAGQLCNACVGYIATVVEVDRG